MAATKHKATFGHPQGSDSAAREVETSSVGSPMQRTEEYAVKEEDTQLRRAVGDVDNRRREEDRPILDQDATEIILDLVLRSGGTDRGMSMSV